MDIYSGGLMGDLFRGYAIHDSKDPSAQNECIVWEDACK